MNNVIDSIEDEEQQQSSIMVPVDDDMDTAKDPNTVDELAMELATLKQPAKRVAIIGSRNLAITHQQLIETLSNIERIYKRLKPSMLADAIWIICFIYFYLSRGWSSIYPASEGVVSVFYT